MAQEKEKPLTREDVLKLIEEHGGTAKGLDLSGKEFEAGINLQGLDLQGIILKSAVFNETFVPPRLSGAHLEKANLSGANMEGAKLWYARLERTDLSYAHLERTVLADAHLEGANLFGTYLEETYLGGAHLAEASLYGAKFSRATGLEDVDWGNYVLGEEQEHDFDLAEDTYRQLKIWYTNAGMYDIAAKFYYREKEANRKGIKLYSKHWNDRLAAEFMRALFGYGEEWKRIFGWIAVVIFGLAGVYHLWGSFSSSSCWDTLYYSAVSFTALGYGKWAPQPEGWAKGVGVAEAIIGVFMMALLLVTFVRKWAR
jgi:uncharacterized protein YjbI with pentapeptide repeats